MQTISSSRGPTMLRQLYAENARPVHAPATGTRGRGHGSAGRLAAQAREQCRLRTVAVGFRGRHRASARLALSRQTITDGRDGASAGLAVLAQTCRRRER
jgi:hypothetical protein